MTAARTLADFSTTAINLTSQVTGVLPLANGGTNSTTGYGVVETDSYRISSDVTGDKSPFTTWERADDVPFSKSGTGITQNTGVFTFPSTGHYFIMFQWSASCSADDDSTAYKIEATTNNSAGTPTFEELSKSEVGFKADKKEAGSCAAFIDVTDTGERAVRFTCAGSASTTTHAGGTDTTITGVHFIKLSDT